jgi:tryptophan synthase alpha chain
MKRIDEAFAKANKENRAALITYICAGDPDIETTKQMVYELAKRGVDLIELGVPFSDPIADGPTIQRAAQRALKHNTNIPAILELVRELRKTISIPIILMGYYNPFHKMGLKDFAIKAIESGVDGIIIPDLPPEEAEDWINAAHPAGLDTIFLLAPTSNDERIQKVSSICRGFVYYVSVLGVTGARNELPAGISDKISSIKGHSKLPVGVGFGISSSKQVKQIVSTGADGVIVGSAIISIIENNLNQNDLVSKVGDFVSELREGLSR